MAVAELSRKRAVRGFVSKDGIAWLAGVLKIILEEDLGGGVGAEGRWRDQLGAVLVMGCVNNNGRFAKVEIHRKREEFSCAYRQVSPGVDGEPSVWQ